MVLGEDALLGVEFIFNLKDGKKTTFLDSDMYNHPQGIDAMSHGPLKEGGQNVGIGLLEPDPFDDEAEAAEDMVETFDLIFHTFRHKIIFKAVHNFLPLLQHSRIKNFLLTCGILKELRAYAMGHANKFQIDVIAHKGDPLRFFCDLCLVEQDAAKTVSFNIFDI